MLIRSLALCKIHELAKTFRQQPESLLTVLNLWLTECLKLLAIPPRGMSQDEAAQWLHICPALESIERAAILAAPESEPCREFLAMLAARNVQSSRVGGEIVGYHFSPCSKDSFNALVNIVRVMNGTPPADPDDTPPDTRKDLMREIIEQNPSLKRKGEPDSILKRFRQECKARGLSGINEKDGLAMIRDIKGVPKKPRNTN